jgi:phosphoglucosamine mutase
LPDDQEELLEDEIFRLLEGGVEPTPQELPIDGTLDETYVDYLASTIATPLTGMKIVLDCAHGGASHLAPELFTRLGAEVIAIGVEPTGRNINLNSGALHVEELREEVLRRGADAGVAFDGDADRAILISHSGKIVDGDCVLLIAASDLLSRGRLAGSNGKPAVVATVMSNLGLERALAEQGIQLIRTPVGDKYVLEEMVRRGIILGGEQSGHVIFRDHATTGDGMLTALRVLEIVQTSGKNLDDLSSKLINYPQRLINVRVKDRKPLSDMAGVQREIRKAEEAFGNAGRVLVRFSGTEPLARVMVEGPDLESVGRYAEQIATAIRTELG